MRIMTAVFIILFFVFLILSLYFFSWLALFNELSRCQNDTEKLSFISKKYKKAKLSSKRNYLRFEKAKIKFDNALTDEAKSLFAFVKPSFFIDKNEYDRIQNSLEKI